MPLYFVTNYEHGSLWHWTQPRLQYGNK